ncbi:MAG TPA: hypothetical protein VHO28_04660 [Ignavibacteriales bacterium]|nr:hypothetical protein [Ignavibacteriales bacterium]
MSKIHLILLLIFAAALFSGCDRESAPSGLNGFSEGEYHGSFELRFESSLSGAYEILQEGEVNFLFEQADFYYNGVLQYASDNNYPLGIGSGGSYNFVNDTIYFKERYTPQDSITSQALDLSYLFACTYSGNVMYLTKYSGNEKLTITLRKR